MILYASTYEGNIAGRLIAVGYYTVLVVDHSQDNFRSFFLLVFSKALQGFMCRSLTSIVKSFSFIYKRDVELILHHGLHTDHKCAGALTV